MTKQEAIEYLKDPIGKSLEQYDEAVNMAITALQAQEEQRWIPVSERPPEREDESIMAGHYLTTTYDGSVCIRRYEFETIYGPEGWCPGTGIQIIAWKPLPEPYKEGEG